MKCKNLLLTTVLLAQTATVWAMDIERHERNNKPQQKVRTHQELQNGHGETERN